MEQEEQASYQEGDWVLVHHSRLPDWPRSTGDDPYFGPYKILSVDKTERTKDWVRVLPVISLMMNSQESSATGYTPHELFMGRAAWFLHAPYPEDSYSTVGKWLKEQQDKVDNWRYRWVFPQGLPAQKLGT